jgi:hypothetical protein
VLGIRVGRYFFNLYDDDVVLDEEGSELPDLDAARARAFAGARDMACAEVLEGHLTLDHRIEVVDESGERVCTVHFRDVVSVEPQTA